MTRVEYVHFVISIYLLKIVQRFFEVICFSNIIKMLLLQMSLKKFSPKQKTWKEDTINLVRNED